MKDIEGYEGLYAVTEDGKVWAYPKDSGKYANRNKHGMSHPAWVRGLKRIRSKKKT